MRNEAGNRGCGLSNRQMGTVEREITVGVHCGVHGRVATGLARLAGQPDTRLEIRFGEQVAECSSILEILALGISRGSRITVRAIGRTAAPVLEQACELLTGEAH